VTAVFRAAYRLGVERSRSITMGDSLPSDTDVSWWNTSHWGSTYRSHRGKCCY